MLKITQPHLSMNNMFPPINTHSRPPSEDLHGVSSGGVADINSASKHQKNRRQQQTLDQHRRSPLRSNSLLTTTTSQTRYTVKAAAVAVPADKIIYRSNDYAWNDHPNKTNVSNQPIRAASPIKAKYSTSARHLVNGILHEGTTNSMLHLPTTTSSTTPIVHQEINNGNLNLSSATKSRLPIRLNRTNSHLDKASGPNNYGLPMRSDSYRSSRLDYGLRPRHTSSKQRNYVASKTSSHDVNADSTQDENVYHQQPVNVISSTQRLNGSSFDLNASRKIFSPNKTNSFNITAHHNYFSSTQELHHSGATADRNYSTRFVNRDTTSKEQILTTPKYRQTTTTTPAVTSTNPVAVTQTNERHPSAQSYKSRDPNISYAYTDVKKYIEENELMSQEKEQTIRNWIIDVEKYRHQLQKIE